MYVTLTQHMARPFIGIASPYPSDEANRLAQHDGFPAIGDLQDIFVRQCALSALRADSKTWLMPSII
jgi:hypothetical protein